MMTPMCFCFTLSWLSRATLLVPPVSVPSMAPAAPGAPASLVAPCVTSTFPATVALADTGEAPASLPGLLTTDAVLSYAAVEKELGAYWATHPDQVKKAEQGAKGVNVGIQQGATTGWPVPNYPVVVQQDTAVAAIFTQHHFAPAQFIPTMAAVRNAIAAVLQHASVDSSTITGKNMAFVQAHRPELAADWSAVQVGEETARGVIQRLFQMKGGLGGRDSSTLAP